MKNQYEIPNSATKYILFQRTEYLTFAKARTFKALQKLVPLLNYNQMVGLEARLRSRKVKEMYLTDMEGEYSSIQKFLPDNCSSILDVGCGVAGIDLFLNQHYLNRKVDFYLLDKSHVEKEVYYMYQSKGAFYNSLHIARDILVNNGVDKNKIHLIEAKDNNSIDMDKGVDLVVSLISWGFHYPVSIYLDQVYDLLNKTGTLILDIRKSTEGLDLLTQKFGEYRVILETRKSIRICVTK